MVAAPIVRGDVLKKKIVGKKKQQENPNTNNVLCLYVEVL